MKRLRTKLTLTPPIFCLLLLVPDLVRAEEDKKGFDQAYQLGKDIARLESEIVGLKGILSELLELDRRRVQLLEQALSGLGSSQRLPAVTLRAPQDRSVPPMVEPQVDSAHDKGSVAGKVTLFPGAPPVAYVYVENAPGRVVRNRTVIVNQLNRQFSPRYLVVERGTKVEFPNKDSMYHNVFSQHPQATFDLGIYRSGDTPKTHVFASAGDIDVFCNMHSNMTARVLVVPNQLYTKVNADGSFVLSNVPRGRRKIMAWAPEAESASELVNVETNQTAQISFTLQKRTDQGHLNKSGQPYGSYK